MKFYEAEMRAHDFWGGWHTLQEWADFGYNKVVYNGKEYWDGLEQGEIEIDDPDVELEMDYWDIDCDGYIAVYLVKAEED